LKGDDPIAVESDTESSDDEEEENPARNYGNRVQGPWIFGLSWKRGDGILERRFFKVDDRKKSTLLPIVLREVAQDNYSFRLLESVQVSRKTWIYP